MRFPSQCPRSKVAFRLQSVLQAGSASLPDAGLLEKGFSRQQPVHMSQRDAAPLLPQQSQRSQHCSRWSQTKQVCPPRMHTKDGHCRAQPLWHVEVIMQCTAPAVCAGMPLDASVRVKISKAVTGGSKSPHTNSSALRRGC